MPHSERDIAPTQPIGIDIPTVNQNESSGITSEFKPIVSLSPAKITRIREFQSHGKRDISTDSSGSEQGLVKCQCGWEGEEIDMVRQLLKIRLQYMLI